MNDYIKDEVYVKQPSWFEDPKEPNHVYKFNNALYWLKPAPRVWYERLNKFLISQGFSRRKINTTMFTKGLKVKILVEQIYVNDLIFGSKDTKFMMSMVRELNFFLGLQIK